MDMGFATSTPPVDQDPAAGWYEGTGRFGRVRTNRTPVIFNLLFSPWNGTACAPDRLASPKAAPLPYARKSRRRMMYGFDYWKPPPPCQGAFAVSRLGVFWDGTSGSAKEGTMRRRTFISTSAVAGLSMGGARGAK